MADEAELEDVQELMLSELVCPLCGSTEVSFDYTSMVSVQFDQGKLVHIHFGGPFGAGSDSLNCASCGVFEQEATLDQDLRAEQVVKEQAPPVIAGGMIEGFLIYDPDAGPPYREFTAFGIAE